MANIEKRKTLKSIQYHFHEDGSETVDFKWSVRSYIKDELIAEIPESIQSGAFPVNANGELNPDDEKLVGKKLSKVLGEVGKSAVVMSKKVAEENEQLKEKTRNVESHNEFVQEEKIKLREQLSAMTLERDMLAVKVEELEQVKTEKPTKK